MIEIKIIKALHGSTGEFEMSFRYLFPSNQVTAIYGPSGSGKTTLLRMIAGLTRPDSGFIRCGKETWFDHSAGIFVAAGKRKIAYVSQEISLFPNMDVRENIGFAVRDKKIRKRRVNEAIEMLDLGQLASKKPSSLSGGQQQRVALGRTLALDSEIMLLDEPFSAMDTPLRQNICLHLKKRFAESPATVLLVSHSIPEVLSLATGVVKLEDGKVSGTGHPLDILGNGMDASGNFVAEIAVIENADGIPRVKALFGGSLIDLFPDPEILPRLHAGLKVKLHRGNIQRNISLFSD